MKNPIKSRFCNTVFVLFFFLFAIITAAAFNGGGTTHAAWEPSIKYIDLGYEIAPMADDEFSIVIVGDTQKAVEYYPDFMYSTTQWVADNADALNLEYYIAVGDIVDDATNDVAGSDYIAQFKVVDEAYKTLDDAGVPYALAMGNHDYNDMTYNVRSTENFDKYFPYSRYADMPSFGGSKTGTNIEDTIHFFTAPTGEEFMILVFGHHPTDESIEWGNRVVEANPDKTVIVATHGYMEGDGNSTRTPRGEHLWQNLVKKHENIEYLFCGHEIGIEEGNIVENIEYGINGNPIYQYMVNSQAQDFGGAGLAFIMRFRNDGSVECNYYCPSFDKYFMAANQFTFMRELPVPPLADGTVVGATGAVGGQPLQADYYIHEPGTTSWQSDTYAHDNLVIGEKGMALATAGSGFVVYEIEAGEGSVLKELTLNYSGNFGRRNLTDNISAGLRIDISTDGGLTYQASRFIGPRKHITAEGFSLDTEFRRTYYLHNYVRNHKKAHIRVVLSTDDPSETYLTSLKLTSTDVVAVNASDSDGFGTKKNFKDFSNFMIDEWSQDCLQVYDMLVFDGYLGVGRKSDYSGAKGFAEWKFVAGEGRTIETLDFKADGRMIGIDMGWAFRIYLSFDDGETYEMVAEEKGYRSTTVFNYDLSEHVEGKKEVRLKLSLWGSYWHVTGLNNLEINGTYRYAIDYVLNGGTNADSNPSDYLKADADIALSDPMPPAHCEFKGWYTSSDFSGTALTSIAAGSVGAKTLYAKWEATEYGISYELDGGKLTGAENPGSYTYFESITLHNPTKTGYTFAGWYRDGEFTGNRITSIEEGSFGELTLYAKWLRNYRVTYVLGGGSLEGAPETFTSEDAFEFGTPVREGYDFQGWYRDAGYTQEISGITAGTEAALIVYAKWKAETEPVTEYGITYNLDGGVNAASNPAKYTAGTAVTLAAPSRSGYIFEGWYGDAEYSGEKVERIEAGAEGEVVLYAKWRKEAETPPPEDGGCNGMCNGAGLALMMLALSGALVIKRKGSKV